MKARNGGAEHARAAAAAWIERQPQHHSLNLLVATVAGQVWIFLFPRDQRRSTATHKGLVGGFEVAGDFVLSAPHEEDVYREASADIAHAILSQINPTN